MVNPIDQAVCLKPIFTLMIFEFLYIKQHGNIYGRVRVIPLLLLNIRVFDLTSFRQGDFLNSV